MVFSFLQHLLSFQIYSSFYIMQIRFIDDVISCSNLHNAKTWISLEQKKILQKGKHHSSSLLKGFQTFLLHMHFKYKVNLFFFLLQNKLLLTWWINLNYIQYIGCFVNNNIRERLIYYLYSGLDISTRLLAHVSG